MESFSNSIIEVIENEENTKIFNIISKELNELNDIKTKIEDLVIEGTFDKKTYSKKITEVEKKAVEDAVKSAGARQVFLIEESMAAAIGARLPVADPTATYRGYWRRYH